MDNKEMEASGQARDIQPLQASMLSASVRLPHPSPQLEYAFWDAPTEHPDRWREIRERDFNLTPVEEHLIPDRIEGHRLRYEDKLRLLVEVFIPDEESAYYYHVDGEGFLRKHDISPGVEKEDSYIPLKDVVYPSRVPKYDTIADAELRGMARAANSYFEKIGLAHIDYETRNGMQTLMTAHLHGDDPAKISAITNYLVLLENRPKAPRLSLIPKDTDRHDAEIKAFIAADRLYRPQVIGQEDQLKQMDIFPASLLYLRNTLFLQTVGHLHDIRAQHKELQENPQLAPVTVQPLREDQLQKIDNYYEFGVGSLPYFTTAQLQSVPGRIDGHRIDKDQFLAMKEHWARDGTQYLLHEDGRIERRQRGPDGREKNSFVSLKDVEFTEVPRQSPKPWEGGEDRRPDAGLKR